MKLSKLVYLCVKNVILFDDAPFDYESFIQGKFNGDPDYATSINNVYTSINQAISRLSDLERIPYRVNEIQLNDYAFSISAFENLHKHNIKEIVAIAYIDSNKSILPLNFREVGDKVIVDCGISNIKVHVEYKEDIFFNEGDFDYKYTVDELGEATLLTSKDIELREYGIKDETCNAIVEYVKGALSEPVETALSNMHTTRAEQYFMNINPVRSAFAQTSVYKKWRVDD